MPGRDRTFQSREIIWSTFESIAREEGVPIDDLVNEAMAAYARVRGYDVPVPAAGSSAFDIPTAPAVPAYQAPASPRGFPPPRIMERHPEDHLEETHDGPQISALDRSYAPARAPDDFDDEDLARTSTRQAFPRAGGSAPPERSPSRPVPAALGRMPSPAAGRPADAYSARPPLPAGGPPPLPPRQFPPTTIPMPGAPQREPAQQKRLVLQYQGRKYTVDKDRYLIGRSKTQADLRLDDPNVSRQHAVIERVGSAWYIVDLGSTNGVQVANERVARRAIADGDVIVITSHEIRCALR